MAHTLKIILSDEQYRVLAAHAKKKGRSEEDDLKHVWWGRTQALVRYEEKLAQKDAAFRVYTPRSLDAEEREKIRKALGVVSKKVLTRRKPTTPKVKEAPKPAPKKAQPKAVPITKSDTPEEACAKAEAIVDADTTGQLTEAQVLKAAGRNLRGKIV